MLANTSMIALVIISNIYNTTPNKQIVISFLMQNQEKNFRKEENNLNKISCDIDDKDDDHIEVETFASTEEIIRKTEKKMSIKNLDKINANEAFNDIEKKSILLIF